MNARTLPGQYTRSRLHAHRAAQQRRPGGRLSLRPLIVLGILFAAGMLYVAQMNRVATGGLTIRKFERAIAQLKLENQELEISAARFQSLATVERNAALLHLDENTRSLVYLPQTDTPVALRR